MRFQNLMALVALLTPLGSRANAADQPLFAPTRDVTVDYHVTGVSPNNGATEMRVAYADNSQRVRLDLFSFKDAKSPFGTIIFDGPADQILSLLYQRRSYFVIPAKGRANPGLLLSDKMTYTHNGEAFIAGLPCLDWRITNGNDFAGSTCVSKDGVVLRAIRTKPNPGTLEATVVTFGTPPADVFKPGPDLRLAPSE